VEKETKELGITRIQRFSRGEEVGVIEAIRSGKVKSPLKGWYRRRPWILRYGKYKGQRAKEAK